MVLNSLFSDIGSIFSDRYEIWASEYFEKRVFDFYRVKAIHKKKGYQFLIDNKDEIIKFWDNILEIHFLDVHRGITNKKLLLKILEHESKKKEKIKMYVHATPYLYLNFESNSRKHIKPEIDEFISITKCHFKIYLKDKPMTLQHHFDVLRCFDVK